MAAEVTSAAGREEPCAASTVLGWERGESAPSLVYAVAILKVTDGDVTLVDLIRTSEGLAP